MDHLSYLTEVTGEKALQFAKTQNKISDARIKSDSRYQPTFDQVYKIVSSKDKLPFIHFVGRDVYNFWQDDKHKRGLLRRTTIQSFNSGKPVWETVLDIDLLAQSENKNWVYKRFTCLEPQNELCLMLLSDGGKDAVVYREFNLKTLKFVENGFYIPESKTSASWYDENTLLIGDGTSTSPLTSSGYPSVTKVLKRGTLVADAPILFKGDLKSVSSHAYSYLAEGKRFTFVNESTSFYEENYYSVDLAKMKLQKVHIPKTSYIAGFHKGHFLIYLREALNEFPAGSLLALRQEDLHQENPPMQIVFKPSATEFYQSSQSSKSYLYVQTLQDVKERLLRYEFTNGAWKSSPVLFADTNGNQAVATISDEHNEVYFHYTDFLSPSTYYFVNDSQAPDIKKVMQSPAYFNAEKYKVEQFKVKSKDGTLIPYFVVSSKKMLLNSLNPTLINAYGGFEIALTPNYLGVAGSIWLDKGGVYVVANIRGGGEYGPDWHKSVLREKRHKVYEDFYAVAEDLIAKKITSPRHLGIKGGSNGGLLTSVAFTQRPDLYNAVISEVPLANMMEYHKWLAGASWMEEYGNPDDPEMREYLLSYSPLHNLKKDQKYPEVFYLTSTKDDRVHPAHARQMVARLIELGYPVLYNENTDGGHGRATTTEDWAEFIALEYTYLYQKLMDERL